MIIFTIPGIPRGKGRTRATTRGGFARMYTDAQTASYENLVRLCCAQEMGGAPCETALQVSISAYFPIPESASKKAKAAMLVGGIPHTKKPDIDNVIKAILDGMNGVVFKDDKQIIRLFGEKYYSDTPRVEVAVTFAEKEAAP